MGNRIVNRQRKMTEQGRLRFGVYTGSRPKAITTWIVTSHSEPHVRNAARLWGGTVEQWQPQGNGAQQWRVITEASSIPAILPTGDPLSTAYELWSRGGCQRRCNGALENFSGSPCICRAEFGEEYYEQPDGTVCEEKTRLSVYLPEMQGLGVWRMETGSFWGTDEITTALDDIRGAVGDEVLIPVLLRLEQRTSVKKGQTRQYVVPVMDLQGATFGELLSGAVAARHERAVQSAERRDVDGGRPAIEAGTDRDFVTEIKNAATVEDVREVWRAAKTASAPNGRQIEAAAQARVKELNPPTPDMNPAACIEMAKRATTLPELEKATQKVQAAGFARDLTDESDEVAQAFVERLRQLAPPDWQGGPADRGEQPGNRDALWAQIVAAWPGDKTSEIEDALNSEYGVKQADATADQLARFLADIKAGTVKPAQTDSGVPF